MDKYFPLPLIVRHINGRLWELIKPFEYHPDSGEVIRVPEEFLTDFASIPRIFWTIIGSPTGRYGPAAIIHDYLYVIKIYSRRKSDRIFFKAMAILKVPYLKRFLMYLAVRLAGWQAWENYKIHRHP